MRPLPDLLQLGVRGQRLESFFRQGEGLLQPLPGQGLFRTLGRMPGQPPQPLGDRRVARVQAPGLQQQAEQAFPRRFAEVLGGEALIRPAQQFGQASFRFHRLPLGDQFLFDLHQRGFIGEALQAIADDRQGLIRSAFGALLGGGGEEPQADTLDAAGCLLMAGDEAQHLAIGPEGIVFPGSGQPALALQGFRLRQPVPQAALTLQFLLTLADLPFQGLEVAGRGFDLQPLADQLQCLRHILGLQTLTRALGQPLDDLSQAIPCLGIVGVEFEHAAEGLEGVVLFRGDEYLGGELLPALDQELRDLQPERQLLTQGLETGVIGADGQAFVDGAHGLLEAAIIQGRARRALVMHQDVVDPFPGPLVVRVQAEHLAITVEGAVSLGEREPRSRDVALGLLQQQFHHALGLGIQLRLTEPPPESPTGQERDRRRDEATFFPIQGRGRSRCRDGLGNRLGSGLGDRLSRGPGGRLGGGSAYGRHRGHGRGRGFRRELGGFHPLQGRESPFHRRQGTDQLRRVLEPLLRGLGQDLVDEGLHEGQRLRQLGDGRGEMLQGHGHEVLAQVRTDPHQHLVEDHPQAVEVAASIHRDAPGLFRAHVVGGPDSHSGMGELGVVGQRLGDAEIRQHRGLIVPEHDVQRLDVTVDDAVLVGVAEGGGDLFGIENGLRQLDLPPDAVLEMPAPQILHGDVIAVDGEAGVIEHDDMGMGQLGVALAFPQKALAKFRLDGEARRHHLEGDFPPQGFLHGEKDGGHAATAEFPNDLIAGDIHRGERSGSAESAEDRLMLRTRREKFSITRRSAAFAGSKTSIRPAWAGDGGTREPTPET